MKFCSLILTASIAMVAISCKSSLPERSEKIHKNNNDLIANKSLQDNAEVPESSVLGIVLPETSGDDQSFEKDMKLILSLLDGSIEDYTNLEEADNVDENNPSLQLTRISFNPVKWLQPKTKVSPAPIKSNDIKTPKFENPASHPSDLPSTKMPEIPEQYTKNFLYPEDQLLSQYYSRKTKAYTTQFETLKSAFHVGVEIKGGGPRSPQRDWLEIKKDGKPYLFASLETLEDFQLPEPGKTKKFIVGAKDEKTAVRLKSRLGGTDDINIIKHRNEYVVFGSVKTPESVRVKKTLEKDGYEGFTLKTNFKLNDIPVEWKKNQNQLAKELLSDDRFKPVASVKTGEQTFYLSQIFKSSGKRDMAIMYTRNNDGEVMARWLYKSKSDGGWRSSPGKEDNGRYSKGQYIHYTQETKPSKDIVMLMDALYKKDMTLRISDDISNNFVLLDLKFKGSHTYNREIFKYETDKLSEFTECVPGLCFKSGTKDYQQLLRNLDFKRKGLEGFIPDFKYRPKYSYYSSHTLIEGKIKFEVFEGTLEGRKIEWHMASDEKGRVWIDRINFSKGKISSYGVYEEVIDSGVLTNKPIEYRNQAGGLKEKDYRELNSHPEYIDITPLLDNLEPIKRYREARGIVRESA